MLAPRIVPTPRQAPGGLRHVLFVLLILGFAPADALRGDFRLPSDFDKQAIVEGLDRPTAFVYAPDGRLFITEKEGRVRVVTPDGVLLPTPFLVLTVNTDGDRGLVGITLDPDFLENHYVYLAYTTDLVPPVPINAFSRIHRITRMTANGNVALPGSEVILVDGIPSDIDSHNGGALRFGPDGKLYAAIGDGASYAFADPLALRAQDLDQPVGKILRINPDGSAPEDNPFYGDPGATRSKVWQYGLRNPFKATFRPGTGDLFVNDVGWFSFEEIDRAPAGANFGWPCYEGAGPQSLYFAAFPDFCATVAPTPPLVAFPHSEVAAVTGTAFYDATNYPATYQGRLFIGDYVAKLVKAITLAPDGSVATDSNFAIGTGDPFLPVDLLQGPDGNLQILTLASSFTIPSGAVYRILYVGAGNHAPQAAAAAAPKSGYAPLDVQFSAGASSDPDGDPLTCRWDFGDGEGSDACEADHTYTAEGAFIATLAVSDGQVSREAKVTVTVGSLPPVAEIDAPDAQATYEAGETIHFSGSAQDPDEGALPMEDLRWTVILHHDTHQHFYEDATGSGGSFVVNEHDDGISVYAYEIVLTATDASGLSDTRSVILRQNHPPVSRAGADWTAACAPPPGRIVLDGSASSDPDDQPLAYAWTQVDGPAVALEDAGMALASFIAPAVPGGTALVFRLDVNDGHVTDSSTVQVAIPDLTDADGDGDPACSDCTPLDPGTSAPGEIVDLSIAEDEETVEWSPPPAAGSYDLFRGEIDGAFAYDQTCLAGGLPDPAYTDDAMPAPGQALYYLAMSTNGCGSGNLHISSRGEALSATTCP